MEAATRPDASTTALDVRERIVEALELDLIGPWPGHELADERLPGRSRPSNWYLTGFLVPLDTPADESGDIDAEEELAEVQASAGPVEESAEEPGAAKKGFFPSSMGLSTLVAEAAKSLSVTVSWGDYTRGSYTYTTREGEQEEITNLWQRAPRERAIDVPLGVGGGHSRVLTVAESGGLELHVLERPVHGNGDDGRIPPGTRSVSVFLVNHRHAVQADSDRAYAFQPVLTVRCDEPFVPRPDLRGAYAADWEEEMADLHYADTPEYATGHGISADWTLIDRECRELRTSWIPRALVEKTETVKVAGVELGMDALGALVDGSAATAALRPLVDEYRSWISAQQAVAVGLTAGRSETAVELLRIAGIAAARIERGIAVLASSSDALDAFRVANRAVAAALRRRLKVADPGWRAFQLAFILLNLPGIADPTDRDRETVELLFFPTGGGKTEAYLGLSAFTMVLRRLRNPDGLAGCGVSVIMRYTLRLLTLDQLARAAGLVCALELERGALPERYGAWPFEIGLWVGKAATPNLLGKKGDKKSDTARIKVRRFKNDPRSNPSPIPLEECPWCGERFAPDSFGLWPDDDHPRELRIVCVNLDCEFNGDRALPIVAVDSPIYRRLPAFVIATVDKFAALPWTGPSGTLLGGADRRDDHGFYGPAEPNKGMPLDAPLLPPDLVIQDELHLISGPLGTMVGLYETAIEALCVRESNGRGARPKIVASTATVRRASDQIQALFARPQTAIFPPPGPDRRDSFFARTVPSETAPARLYLGIAAQGRNPKVVMRKTWLALMSAAERSFRDAGGHRNPENPADPYMTLLGYFNGLRELGGARRILEEEVQNTLKSYGTERRRIGEPRTLFRDRRTFSEVVELTSRVSTDKVAEARRRLGASAASTDRVDCAIATNMIAVGLDIPRLGLMGVVGQPKTAAEYIQATSRVGRTDEAPGLIVTLLGFNRPRDRSHYERFRHFHDTFYRSVEVGSVTPFSPRALDRGLAGALVGLARQNVAQLTPARGVERIAEVRAELERGLLATFRARVLQQPLMDEDERAERVRSVESRIVDLLDSWQTVIEDYAADSVAVQYQRYELDLPKPLLRDMLDTDFDSGDHAKFRANRSLRDVEPSVNLFFRDPGRPRS
jgi:hypothetical protein